MTVDTRNPQHHTPRSVRRWVACACVAALFTLAGCKTNKEATGTGVSRGKDPLIAGPNMIPKQNMPLPDRATGPKGKVDPLVSPTGGKAGYNEDERFKGTVVPGKPSTPAALAGRLKDGEELKIDDGGGVPLTPAGGTLPGGALEPPAEVAPLYAELDKLGVKREDRTLQLENGKWVFRAKVFTATGARTEYTGVAATAADAVKQVLTQVASDRK